jgi:maltooligosyltrehalose trehalohydrolase
VTNEVLTSFVAFTQNHDAIANTLDGRRLQRQVSPGKYRAITAALLLGPQTPLIFMGQEFNASSVFPYFADYPPQSKELWNSRKKEAAEFAQFRDPSALARILNPCSTDTLRAATLNHAERASNVETFQLFADLIALRKQYVTALMPQELQGALLTQDALVLRWRAPRGMQCLLILNLGPQIECRAWAEPLLAAPSGQCWRAIWASESSRYGGMGAVEALLPEGWQFGAEAAQLLIAHPRMG